MLKVTKTVLRSLPLLGVLIYISPALVPLAAEGAPTFLPPIEPLPVAALIDNMPAMQPKAVTCEACAVQQSAALEKLLGQYTQLAANGGWPEWKIGKKVEAGKSDARIPDLRQILTITGDYTAITRADAHPEPARYDAGLQEAVKHFQARHGLNADGTLGKGTQTALNVPVETRISQIRATLVRIKDNDAQPENKFILVNLPAYTLYGTEEGKTALTMRVIVGNRKNHTPLFDNVVTDVVFNPPWNVPSRIVREEMIPKLHKNPGYFVKAGFTVTRDGVPVDPMNLEEGEGSYSFRQRSGDGNALGKIKFNIPDSDNIYLHSTASPQLFAKDDRALSHGCIRLEKPRDLAYFVLGAEKGWDKPRIDKTYDADRQRSVRVTEVPVHLVYWTAFVDADGTPHFFNDIYNKDKAVMAQLNQQPGIMTMAAK